MAEKVALGDFNERDQAGNVLVLREDLIDPDLRVGDEITVRDGEGNEAQAVVAGLDDRLARLRVDWMSWRDADERTIRISVLQRFVVEVAGDRGTVELRLVPGEASDLMDDLREAVKSSTKNETTVVRA